MIMIGLTGTWRHAILVTGLLSLYPITSMSACWEILTPEKTFTANDLWQVNVGQGILRGDSAGKSIAVPVDTISSFTVVKKSKSEWLSGKRSAVQIEIRLSNDEMISLVSKMNLYYRIGEKRQTIPLGNIISANRCDDEATAVAIPSSETLNQSHIAPSVALQNGDILYGEVADSHFGWKTAYAGIPFQPAELRFLKVDCNAPSTGTLETTAGDLLKGRFLSSTISFRLSTGQVIDIPTDEIRMIDFVGTQAVGHTSLDECRDDQP